MTQPLSSPGSLSAVPIIERAVKQLSKLPGIGPRMAQRLTLALLKRKKEEVQELVDALGQLIDGVNPCPECGNYDQQTPCRICADDQRDRSVICVVEQHQDLIAIERTSQYHGLYHILGGVLSPIDGVGPEEIGIPKLLRRLNEPVREVILATNPTIEGDATAHYIQDASKTLGVRITRLARGLPSGSDIEYADESTLALALSTRSELK
ncbi:MAG: recombination protein RecR [bacterium]|nr:recombination protein RecR [bacterium]